MNHPSLFNTLIMASQMGMFPFRGKIGNVVFYKLNGKWVARAKGGPTAEQIATDPRLVRTRENSAEFGRAMTASQLLRATFQAMVHPNPDKLLARRLLTTMISVVQADGKSERGLRNVLDGKLELVEGFEFNEHGKLSNIFRAPYSSAINRETGEMKISIPAFIPQEMVTAPPSATHLKLISGGAELDFENKAFKVDFNSSRELPLNNVGTPEIVLNNVVPVNSTQPLFLALGIDFYQEVNGVMYRLTDGTFNAMAIVKVHPPVV
jgi:hypothetical protein